MMKNIVRVIDTNEVKYLSEDVRAEIVYSITKRRIALGKISNIMKND